MIRNFPQTMVSAASLGKKAFLSDIAPTNGSDCKNCGGMGMLFLFVATDGPFLTPASPYRGDGKVSKWYGGKWWAGNTHSFTCPECQGEGRGS